MLEVDSHGIKYARDTFAEYGIELSPTAADADVVKTYNSILKAAAVMNCSTDRLFRAIRILDDFRAQRRLARPIPDLNTVLNTDSRNGLRREN